jgi:hypothetical protein
LGDSWPSTDDSAVAAVNTGRDDGDDQPADDDAERDELPADSAGDGAGGAVAVGALESERSDDAEAVDRLHGGRDAPAQGAGGSSAAP